MEKQTITLIFCFIYKKKKSIYLFVLFINVFNRFVMLKYIYLEKNIH